MALPSTAEPSPLMAQPPAASEATSAPVSGPRPPFSIHAELRSLRHEKKNQDLHRLPPGTTVRRRPINHAPVADIHAGAQVPKCVYVSRQTPVIAAVKRVKKILREIERRAVREALEGGGGRGEKGRARRTIGGGGGGGVVAQGVSKVNEVLRRDREEVLVKASGRAMEQALQVAEWFRSKEKEVLCDVVVRTGNISVVDDIIEVEGDEEVGQNTSELEVERKEDNDSSKIECGESTLELIGDTTTTTVLRSSERLTESQKDNEDVSMITIGDQSQPTSKSRKRKRKKKPMYAADDVPEARLRWVKTIEIAISLKG
ncbi:uncharacterized protein A1O9_07644 [Exophiala aquamarina CBS 119918]|uniref:Uncharacterized protein n=1 Tax=Exophiala aquamarina CBS 119918 TaxID=1182545 RepID=A0A072P9V3_9EURO|nr:uncharacterized protein A1O9_07644 [Exophiala aquamarina CBS 119918]KEF56063.1 hypothetical protein A1O9_07644 [Exophiala aquamarina CBS 119918]